MKITYDPEADAMYIYFNDQAPDGVVPLTDLIYLHVTEEKQPVGLELLAVSTFSESKETLAAQFELPVAEENPASVQ